MLTPAAAAYADGFNPILSYGASAMQVTSADNAFPCPCCGFLSFDEPPGSFDICPICFWADSVPQLRYVLSGAGPNKVSLLQAQHNYATFGAMEERFVKSVRRPTPDDQRDPLWRPLDPARDKLAASPYRDPVSELVETDEAMAGDATLYYYWRSTAP